MISNLYFQNLCYCQNLSYKQFDYLDLEEKIKLLNNSSFEKEGIRNKNFVTDRFSEKIIVKKFMDVVND